MNPYSVNPSLFFSVLDQNQALVTGLESSITLYRSPIAFLNLFRVDETNGNRYGLVRIHEFSQGVYEYPFYSIIHPVP